jgi:hypothetical protein
MRFWTTEFFDLFCIIAVQREHQGLIANVINESQVPADELWKLIELVPTAVGELAQDRIIDRLVYELDSVEIVPVLDRLDFLQIVDFEVLFEFCSITPLFCDYFVRQASASDIERHRCLIFSKKDVDLLMSCYRVTKDFEFLIRAYAMDASLREAVLSNCDGLVNCIQGMIDEGVTSEVLYAIQSLELRTTTKFSVSDNEFYLVFGNCVAPTSTDTLVEKAAYILCGGSVDESIIHQVEDVEHPLEATILRILFDRGHTLPLRVAMKSFRYPWLFDRFVRCIDDAQVTADVLLEMLLLGKDRFIELLHRIKVDDSIICELFDVTSDAIFYEILEERGFEFETDPLPEILKQIRKESCLIDIINKHGHLYSLLPLYAAQDFSYAMRTDGVFRAIIESYLTRPRDLIAFLKQIKCVQAQELPSKFECVVKLIGLALSGFSQLEGTELCKVLIGLLYSKCPLTEAWILRESAKHISTADAFQFIISQGPKEFCSKFRVDAATPYGREVSYSILVDASERDFEASLMRSVFLLNSPDYLCVRPRGRVFSVASRIRFPSAKYDFVGAITRQLTMSTEFEWSDSPELILFRRSDIAIDEFDKSNHVSACIELKICDQMKQLKLDTSKWAQDDETKALAALLFQRFQTTTLFELFVGDPDFSDYFFDGSSAFSHGFELVLNLAKVHPDRRKLIEILTKSLSAADGSVLKLLGDLGLTFAEKSSVIKVITSQQLRIAGFDNFVVGAYRMTDADYSQIFEASIAKILIRHIEFSHFFLNPSREIQELLIASASDEFLLEVTSQTSDDFFVLHCLSRLGSCKLYINRFRNINAHFEMRQNCKWIIQTLTSESFYIRETGYRLISALWDRSHPLDGEVLFDLFERITSALHLKEAVEFFDEHSDNLSFALASCLFGREKIEPLYAEALFEYLWRMPYCAEAALISGPRLLVAMPHDASWSRRVEFFFILLEQNPPISPPPVVAELFGEVSATAPVIAARIVRYIYGHTTPDNICDREALLVICTEAFVSYIHSLERIYLWPIFLRARMYGYPIILPLQAVLNRVSSYRDTLVFRKCLVMAIQMIKQVLHRIEWVELGASFVLLVNTFGKVAAFLAKLPFFPESCLWLSLKYLRCLMYIDATIIHEYQQFLLRDAQKVTPADPKVHRQCAKLVTEIVREVCADAHLAGLIDGAFVVYNLFVRQYLRQPRCSFIIIEPFLRLAAAVLNCAEFANDLREPGEIFGFLNKQTDWPPAAVPVWRRFIRAVLARPATFNSGQIESFVVGMGRHATAEKLEVLKEIIVVAGPMFGPIATKNVDVIYDIAEQIQSPMMTEIDGLFLVAAVNGIPE